MDNPFAFTNGNELTPLPSISYNVYQLQFASTPQLHTPPPYVLSVFSLWFPRLAFPSFSPDTRLHFN